VGTDAASAPLAGEGAQVLRSAEPARDDERREVFGVELRERQDVSARDARRLHEHVPRLAGYGLARQAVDAVVLPPLGRAALNPHALVAERPEPADCLTDLAPILEPTPAENDGNLLVHGALLLLLGVTTYARRRADSSRAGAPEGPAHALVAVSV